MVPLRLKSRKLNGELSLDLVNEKRKKVPTRTRAGSAAKEQRESLNVDEGM